jgi:hypothetical protein
MHLKVYTLASTALVLALASSAANACATLHQPCNATTDCCSGLLCFGVNGESPVRTKQVQIDRPCFLTLRHRYANSPWASKGLICAAICNSMTATSILHPSYACWSSMFDLLAPLRSRQERFATSTHTAMYMNCQVKSCAHPTPHNLEAKFGSCICSLPNKSMELRRQICWIEPRADIYSFRKLQTL